MNWGKSIVLAFVLFAIFIGVLVTVCVKQDVSLVSKNYYQEELGYQQQIERMANTERMEVKPAMLVVGRQLEVRFADGMNVEQVELNLFRPSDSRWDRKFKLDAPDSTQYFDLNQLPSGRYKAQLRWSMAGKEYYLENSIQL